MLLQGVAADATAGGANDDPSLDRAVDLYFDALRRPLDFCLDRRRGDRGRLHGHQRRLREPGRSPEEAALGGALDAILLKGVVAPPEAADSVLNGQSQDTTMFWTLSPYVLQRLRGAGFGEAAAVARLVSWGASGDRRSVGTSLEGLEAFNVVKAGDRAEFVLSKDPSDVTHQAARAMASYAFDHSRILSAPIREEERQRPSLARDRDEIISDRGSSGRTWSRLWKRWSG
jgi:hypothetical protein